MEKSYGFLFKKIQISKLAVIYKKKILSFQLFKNDDACLMFCELSRTMHCSLNCIDTCARSVCVLVGGQTEPVNLKDGLRRIPNCEGC